MNDRISRAEAKQQISEWATIITNPTLLDKDATMVVLDTLPSAEASGDTQRKDRARYAAKEIVLARIEAKIECAEKRLHELKTHIAEPKTGEWKQISPARIYECSECGQNVMTSDIEAYKFCHGCGARMLREDGEE